jgi:hypothetical protein
MPRQGVVSSFSFGRATGAVETVALVMLARVEWVTPSIWKKHFCLGTHKRDSVDAAKLLLVRNYILAADGLCEAALIARWTSEPMAASLRRCDITVYRIIEAYAKIAFTHPAQMFEKDRTTLRRMCDLPSGLRFALAGVKLDDDGRIAHPTLMTCRPLAHSALLSTVVLSRQPIMPKTQKRPCVTL